MGVAICHLPMEFLPVIANDFQVLFREVPQSNYFENQIHNRNTTFVQIKHQEQPLVFLPKTTGFKCRLCLFDMSMMLSTKRSFGTMLPS